MSADASAIDLLDFLERYSRPAKENQKKADSENSSGTAGLHQKPHFALLKSVLVVSSASSKDINKRRDIKRAFSKTMSNLLENRRPSKLSGSEVSLDTPTLQKMHKTVSGRIDKERRFQE
jgi:hypothetical protein